MRPTVALINDTSLFEDHFGCLLVGQTFREQFARTGLDLKYAFPRDYELDTIAPLLEKVDLVVVNGEGSIHHGKRNHLLDVARRFPSVLVNAVYQENPRNEALDRFLYRSARESQSADEVRQLGLQCDVTPDVIFAAMQLRSFVKPDPIEDLGVTDSVLKKRRTIGPIQLKKQAYGFRPNTSVANYLHTLSSYQRLCIGRFHAVVAASVLGIPFSCWESNTWKISGLMQDMGAPEYCYTNFSQAFDNVPALFDDRIQVFADGAVGRIESMFDNIATIAGGAAD
ncbi:polysaccharide pyruvyl transferase family protein [Chromohalobacter sarecensis]|uniref:Polysaccharide pyruvyl transferase family protein n=1 Tax=Chromohalobacter sarecensis TaxID=245294 RepID=A0ABV9CZF3_9GAMM|nr:polysaccharide pyruvyl transferase family protein [Chromohalobacter sarecensis]MCK0713471.1 polysaccharide pyruvyl transferase family protein [Chromohalobacter sarecensis]